MAVKILSVDDELDLEVLLTNNHKDIYKMKTSSK